MIRHRWPIPLAWLVLSATALGADPRPFDLIVEAGRHARRETPIRVELPAAALPDSGSAWVVHGEGPAPIPVQVDRPEGTDRLRLTWVLPGVLDAGSTRRFRLESTADSPRPWSLTKRPDGTLELKNRERIVFRYNMEPTSHPNYGPIQRRDAYIHPAFTPSGTLITGDFSKAHTHHRGFFLAYTKTHTGDLSPDFWNFQSGTGKVHFDRLESSTTGPVTARFVVHHRWKAKGDIEVMRERWEVEAYDVPGQPYWLFDLTSTQRAVGNPLELLPYRYGGMAYRGPDSFLPPAKLDVLTSEGLDRKSGDQKPARWVDLTGPIEGDSSAYAGAMMADHPSNVNHPTVARIHPTGLPFFTYVPGHDTKVVIGTDKPSVFRYRVMIHDGRPDKEKDERVWRDFAEPPVVRIDPR